MYELVLELGLGSPIKTEMYFLFMFAWSTLSWESLDSGINLCIFIIVNVILFFLYIGF